jgi:hypothetical protein
MRGVSGGSGPRIPSGGSGGKVDKGAAAAAALIAAGFTIGMIGTEGARYDGWTQVHPAQPVHLIYAGGEQRAIPLYLLSAADLQGVDEAVISENDGRIDRLARAPLDRKGWAWRFDLGTAGGTTYAADQRALGWGVLMSLGYFPLQSFGILLNSTLAGGDDSGISYLNTRLGLEADWLPLALWRFHAGLFGYAGRQWGWSSSFGMGEVSHTGSVLGGGALVEIDLTTRLALLVRGGLLQEYRDQGPSAPAMFLGTVGVSIY